MKYCLTFLLCVIALSIEGQNRASFAVFVDEKTYSACEKEILDYKESIERYNDLRVYVFHQEWQNPEQIKTLIDRYFREDSLEGAVFVGDIPVPMVRGAQHLTSAFKMSETEFPPDESSVPSDRYYDDLSLRFDFIGRDSVHANYFYYNLRPDSPQRIQSDIYSGRIKPSLEGEAGYEQVRRFLIKAVAEKSQNNPLDKFFSYTGEGSYSNSLSAWKDEAVTLREQIPDAFLTADGAKFYIFSTSPDVREFLKQELRRPDIDLALFHGHGLPERQYLTGEMPSTDMEEHYENGLQKVRSYLRYISKRPNENLEEVKSDLLKTGITDYWFENYDDPATIVADSLAETKRVFGLDDISEIVPNPRLVIFDACYNGDFRNADFVADRYIFSEGRTVACIGNSVNILQDKYSCDLLGMMTYGYSVGEWYRHVNVLESHIIGDPTFRFTSAHSQDKPSLLSNDAAYWQTVLQTHPAADIRSLALHKLCSLKTFGMDSLLLDVFTSSPCYTERLQAFQLLMYYDGDCFVRALEAGLNDPYEFIRRKSVFYAGKTGRSDLLPRIVDLYLNDYLSERIEFNFSFITHHFDAALLKLYFKKAIDKADFIFDKKAFYQKIETVIDRNANLMAECRSCIFDTTLSVRNRLFYITILRNNPFPQALDDIFVSLRNSDEKTEIRLTLAEALGWFTLSQRKGEIIDFCNSLVKSGTDKALSDELNKTVRRLMEYTR